ncbi:ScyD/ScyE family protein [Curtobacterium sp. MCPF17_002]|uniref:ScyD/ScyE family protein n=1 Tax=Curtobacterium sp. MCPF17_002 TaxID=2175645 RepID=UPI000DA9A2F7|nr:ScyD/ScyE family protein [Curtobacterium sp. MCPF17_002]WIB78712.1 ScyD/ScyE family protein [Curtobacterium sp. MCPF17_002]
MKRTILVGAVAALALATVAVGAPAQAGGSDHRLPGLRLGTATTLATGLVSPLSLEVDQRGRVDVAQNFAGQLTRVGPGATRTTLATAPTGLEIGAVSSRADSVYYAQNDQPNGVARLMVLPPRGAARQLADLGAYEARVNPDRVNGYGFRGLPSACAAQVDPTGPAGPARYRGVVDSHPYASLAQREGVYVADAGGNDVLRVGYDGRVSTVAVLPPQPPIRVDAATAAEFGFPACVVGYGYAFEPVPTDVERGPDGWLYVSTLPGGPESASLGARGSVYKVNPWNGAVQRVATGFVGATNLAVDQRSGAVLVTELFGGAAGTGQISVVSPWSGRTVQTFAVSSPAAIELRNGAVYATTDAFVPDETGNPQPIGKVVRWSISDSHNHSRWGDDGARGWQ